MTKIKRDPIEEIKLILDEDETAPILTRFHLMALYSIIEDLYSQLESVNFQLVDEEPIDKSSIQIMETLLS